MSIQIEGVEEVLAQLEKVADTQQIGKAVGQACAVVERAAKQKAPKDTGALRRSITSEVNGTEGIVFTPLEYAPYVEYGTGLFAENGGRKDVPWWYKNDDGKWVSTRGQHPQPFMRPAAQESREKVLRLLKESVKL